MIRLDGERMTIAAFARRCVARGMSNAAARAELAGADIDPHRLDSALSAARRAARGGARAQAAGWTDERVARLREIWADGLSASQVAAELGGGITRNAVLGKVHRLGIAMRSKAPAKVAKRVVKPPRPAGPPLPARRLDPSAPIACRSEPDPAPSPSATTAGEDEIGVKMELVKISDLHTGMCKWPIGDPLIPEFRFCGAKSEVGGAYCGYHAQIAYELRPRKRKNSAWRAKGTSGHASARRLSLAETYHW